MTLQAFRAFGAARLRTITNDAERRRGLLRPRYGQGPSRVGSRAGTWQLEQSVRSLSIGSMVSLELRGNEGAVPGRASGANR